MDIKFLQRGRQDPVNSLYLLSLGDLEKGEEYQEQVIPTVMVKKSIKVISFNGVWRTKNIWKHCKNTVLS